jgi:4'-phosphopantetheinyl transferase
MPLFFEQHDLIKASVYLWKIEEPDIFFIEQMPWHQKQLDWLDSIHPQKRMEYLASRFLIYQLTGKLDSHLYKDEAGKLHLEDSNQHVSISHSGEYVGLALSERIVGFDLQKSSAKIHKIAKRFLSKEEYKWLSTQPAEKNLIQAWTIKEAVYKVFLNKLYLN